MRPHDYPIRSHAAAELFPMLPAAELLTLVDDIKSKGLYQPIVVWIDHKRATTWIVDGRNRYEACQRAGLDLDETNFESMSFEIDGQVARYVVSVNLKRRHLSTSERALIAAKLASLYEGAAKERQSAGGRTKVAQECATRGKATEHAARDLNVSSRLVQAAKKVRKSGRVDLVKAIESGAMTVTAAAKSLTEPVREPTNDTPIDDRQEANEDLRHVAESTFQATAHVNTLLLWFEKQLETATPELAEVLWRTLLSLLERARELAGVAHAKTEPTELGPEEREQALAVAAIPEDEFEALVAAPDPPSVEELAAVGRRYMQPVPPDHDEHVRDDIRVPGCGGCERQTAREAP